MEVFKASQDVSWIISRGAFRFRLTDAEFLALLEAAKTNAVISAWLETYKISDAVNLSSKEFQRGLEASKDAGLLTLSRILEIVGTPASEAERL